jgi:predicted transcriptional regulator YdeE
MEVTIIQNKSFTFIGMSIETLLQDVGVKGPALNASFMARQNEVSHRINPQVDYAISVDPPNYNDDTDNYKLTIGVEVDQIDQIPEGMESIEVTATYASVLLKRGDSTFGALYRWVNESEYELADLYSIEIHDHNAGTISLLFPIKKKL